MRRLNRSLKIKRGIDLIGSVLCLGAALPLMAACAALVKLSMGSPVLFRQTRVGQDEERFAIIKFRTMRQPEPGQPVLTTDSTRSTRVGTFLRRFSLDELPELYLVLKGTMSLVGPRPLLEEHLCVYTQRQRERHLAKPGLTGLAQVSGRQHLSFAERLELDVEYVHRWSNALDFRILAKTLGVLISGAGVETGQSIAEVDDIGILAVIRAGHPENPSSLDQK